jgi:hypothetical protein
MALQPSAESAVLVDGSPLPAALAAWSQVDAVLGELTTRYRAAWKGVYGQSLDTLRTDVVDLLVALRLGRPTAEGLAIFPFAARYQPDVRTQGAERSPAIEEIPR